MLAAAFVCRDHSKLEISPGVACTYVKCEHNWARGHQHLAAKKIYMPGREKHLSELRAAEGLACPRTDQRYLRATYGVNKNYANVHRVSAHVHEHSRKQTVFVFDRTNTSSLSYTEMNHICLCRREPMLNLVDGPPGWRGTRSRHVVK